MKHGLGAKVGLRMGDHTELARKHILSWQHLTSARLFAQMATGVEASGDRSMKSKDAHKACVTGAVVFSVAFLEASINELFLAAVDRDTNALRGMTVQQMALLSELWVLFDQKPQVLPKYGVVLTACGVHPFDKGEDPYQGTYGLIELRNALVHYQPEWSDKPKRHQSLEKLIGKRFGLSPFATPAHLWFPHQCLGAGCAKWATEQAETFMTDFCERLGIRNRLPPAPVQ